MNDSLFNLSGRTALVTGGSRGLGEAMARGLADAGAEVVIASRHEDALRTAVAGIRKATGARVEYVVADMTRRQDVRRLAEDAVAALGKIDILVNNAGTNCPQPIDQVRDEDWDRLVELNVTSCMALTRALVPGMKERRWGRVIHISSIMGLASREERNIYSATKSALIGLAQASAIDVGRFGVTVNCLAPGPFATELPLSLLTEEQMEAFGQRTALGRWGQPDELIGPVLLLASDAGSYITGTVLVVDGGVLCRAF